MRDNLTSSFTLPWHRKLQYPLTLLLRLEIRLKGKQRLLDIRSNNAQQPHALNILQVAGLLAALLELQRVEGFVELVDLRFYLGAREDRHVVVQGYPV